MLCYFENSSTETLIRLLGWPNPNK
jgi:hypothetical protein